MSNIHWIVVGRITSPYGIKGGVKVFSYTDPPENILKYKPWYTRKGNEIHPLPFLSGKRHGKGLVVHLKECKSPEEARLYNGVEIIVDRALLPTLAPQDYYWIDLIGLTVITTDGKNLGQITSLFETGSNDVMVVKGERERLVPYLHHVIKDIDLTKKTMCVDWDPEI